MGRLRTPHPLLRRAALGLGLGALAASIVSAQPAPQGPQPAPTAPVAPVAQPAPTETAPPAAAATPPLPPPLQSEDVKPVAAAPKAPVVPEKPAPPMVRSRHDIAVLQALDKVTAETLRFEARVGVPVRWKGLIFTVRACEQTAPDEPVDDSIVYVTIDAQPRSQPGRLTPPPKQAFKGWMYAASPALNPMQHATYDAWAISCRASAPVVAAAPRPPPARPPAAPKVLELPPAKAAPAPKAAEPAPKAAADSPPAKAPTP